ncbi:MAG: PLP-dependent aminotransferase family protein [Candidatus Aminicenantaceae bacterium]
MITIDRESNVPYYIQLRNQIKKLIISGVFRPDTKLPPSRNLAENLKINRNTVLTAYEELEADGLVYSHVGKGTFVSDMNVHVDRTGKSFHRKFNWSNFLSSELDDNALFSLVQLYRTCISKMKISFGGAHPDDELYPVDLVKRCFSSVLKEEKSEIFRYGPVEGFLPLRESLEKKMRNMGVETTVENIFITSGSQQALEITSRILIEAGDYVVTEEPTYTGILSILNTLKAKIIGIPMERDGLNTDTLEEVLRKYEPKFLFTIPNFQNPTGVTMSMSKRKKVIFLAERYNVPILEDDVSGDLRFEGEELPPLKALDRTDQVIYINSLSKELIPGFRVGWAVLNESIRDKFIALKQVEDLATNTISQAILYKFYSRGYLKTHLRRIRKIYRERRDTIIRCIHEYFPKTVEVLKPEGGLFIWVKFPEDVDLRPVYEESMKRGISFSLGNLFYNSSCGKNEMRLCFAAVPPEKIEEGIKILGEIIDTSLRKKRKEDKELEMVPIL